METKQVLEGFAIVVCDRGFVYVGDVRMDDSFAIISNARNIRYWGTERGLGQLALEGPTDKTRLDAVGIVRVPARRRIDRVVVAQVLKRLLLRRFRQPERAKRRKGSKHRSTAHRLASQSITWDISRAQRIVNILRDPRTIRR